MILAEMDAGVWAALGVSVATAVTTVVTRIRASGDHDRIDKNSEDIGRLRGELKACKKECLASSKREEKCEETIEGLRTRIDALERAR